jgi:hypothetical protein
MVYDARQTRSLPAPLGFELRRFKQKEDFVVFLQIA